MTVAAALGAVVAPAALGTASAQAAAKPKAAGATVVATQQIDERTLDLTIDSPAVGKQVKTRLLLPTRWASEPTRTWPVLYLLHGGHDDYTSWTRETDVETFLADDDVLIVMPDAGPTGIPTKWADTGLFGLTPGADYETFQNTELTRLLQADYRAGTTRAVAGVSTGAYGALAMAARFPGTWSAAASYSGIIDTTDLSSIQMLTTVVVREGLSLDALWGNIMFNNANWVARNPTDQAAHLSGTRLYVSQGSGTGDTSGNAEGALLESVLWGQAHTFTSRLSSLRIPATVHFYNGGVHDWPDWEREFKASWPLLAAGLGLTSG
jgi:S-formylglutathione hydrolase FrmB